jgi:hypothetical protein
VANTPDLTACLEVGPGQDDAVLPVNPFLAVRYQFGMLLGVEDFDAAEGYPRGKTRLHNAWLHGAGVVWGFDVQAPQTNPPSDTSLSGELRVKSGLALDRVGHELYLDQDACVDVGAWYALHQDEQAVKDVTEVDAETAVITLRELHVELSFAACLSRQVPAMSEPCDGAAGTSTAYSRVRELVRLTLLPGLAPARADDYPTLRYLFGLGPAPASPSGHQAEAIASVDGGLADQSQFLALFRQCAIADESAMEAATVPPLGRHSYYPPADEAPALMLANLTGVKLTPQAGGAFKMTAAAIDVNVRPAHVATSTLQELHRCAPSAPSASAAISTTAQPATIALKSLGLPFDEATLAPEAFSVTGLAAGGWAELSIASVQKDSADASGKTIAVELSAKPAAGSVVRFIARGTGPTPLLCVGAGGKRVPFRGNSSRGSASDGSDFVAQWEV